jgi:hypothetical protein
MTGRILRHIDEIAAVPLFGCVIGGARRRTGGFFHLAKRVVADVLHDGPLCSVTKRAPRASPKARIERQIHVEVDQVRRHWFGRVPGVPPTSNSMALNYPKGVAVDSRTALINDGVR